MGKGWEPLNYRPTVCAAEKASNCATGYSVVTRVPRGATNLDIRQYAPDDNKDDDIYLGIYYYRFTAVI